MLRNLVYGNVIADFSNSTALGGTLTISNSCKTSSLNNRASIAFAVADISFGTLKKGLFNNNIDSADARITAIIDTVSPTVGTGLSLSVSSNHVNPPVEALRVQSNGNVGIGTQTPQFPLDVNGNIRLGTGTTGNILFGTSGVGTTQAGYIDLVNNTMTVMNQQNGNIIFGTNNGEDMRILSNGNVGIGTQTPQFTLDVNGDVRIGTTSTNTFTLFNNPFNYVPWTTIINHSGQTNARTNFNTHICNVSQNGGGPSPPTADANLRFTYQYSVVGKTLYADLFYYQNTVGAGQTSNGAYFFFLPPPYKTSSDSGKLSPILVSSSLEISGTTGSTRGLGTRIGSGGSSSSSPSSDNLTAYYHVSSTTPYIVLYSHSVRLFNSSTYWQLQFSGSIQINFQVAIPLA